MERGGRGVHTGYGHVCGGLFDLLGATLAGEC